jgi:hypothetical protein
VSKLAKVTISVWRFPVPDSRFPIFRNGGSAAPEYSVIFTDEPCNLLYHKDFEVVCRIHFKPFLVGKPRYTVDQKIR